MVNISFRFGALLLQIIFTMPTRKDYNYNYIYYRKTFTNPKLIREIREIANDTSSTDMDTITRLICEGVSKAIANKKRLAAIDSLSPLKHRV